MLFICCKIVAQELPISESNCFVYDKYSIGKDISNVNFIHQKPNGEILIGEYSSAYSTIGNTTISSSIPEFKDKAPLLTNYFDMGNGLEYYCTSSSIIVVKNKKVSKTIILNPKNKFSASFQKFKNKIYFITDKDYEKLVFKSFDGTSVQNLMTFADTINVKHTGLFISDQIYIFESAIGKMTFYSYRDKKMFFVKDYNINSPFVVGIKNFKNVDNFSCYSGHSILNCANGKINYFNLQLQPTHINTFDNIYNFKEKNNTNTYLSTNEGLQFLHNSTFSSSKFNVKYNTASNSYYAATGTSFLRFFPHIKKYPRVFNNSNSNEIFTLTQDTKGNIWAGSYQGALSLISENKITQSKLTNIMFMNGGLTYKDKTILFGEGNKGAMLFSDANNFKKITPDETFFYGAISKNNTLYLGGFSGHGLWFTSTDNLEKNAPIKWTKITEKEGLKLYNIIFTTEDKFGNIWMGRSGQGIAVYNPKTNKAKTWLMENKEIDFGSMCAVLDNRNTIWFGKSDGGLCFYNGKSENDFDIKNFIDIHHPLLKEGKGISFVKQWSDYLILGARDKVLLFDLKKWYATKQVIVRYANPMEMNLSSGTEQNTIVVDKRDQSVWFSTSDNLYQWDIKKWLSLPTFKVNPDIMVKKDSIENTYPKSKLITFEPTENSFDISINYQTKDNMPRYLNGVLVKKGEELNFDYPQLETKFHYSNLSSGDYVFYVRVCQQDGSFDVFEYPILIKNFLWQNWWFWLLMSLFPISFIVFYFKKRSEIEKQKKKLSQLNLSSLSNQFRPHFMLNALNSIGSQMEDKPHAEKVISRLGESINILYDFTQKNEFTHKIKNEWLLVENIVEIQRLLFIPNLQFNFIGKEIIDKKYRVPVGIIQIPIENALLHGLRHKETGDSILEIKVTASSETFCISINDNGVGRKKAALINNFKNNGNGLKTVFEMIKIINKNQPNSIDFSIEDLPIDAGTLVKIELKKDIDYDKIKL